MSLMKVTQTGSTFRQCSRMALVREGSLPPTSLVDGFSVQQELVGVEACHERPEGVCLSHMDLSHPPERPPGGIVAKQRSGLALGQIHCLARKDIVFGGLAVPDSSPVI